MYVTPLRVLLIYRFEMTSIIVYEMKLQATFYDRTKLVGFSFEVSDGSFTKLPREKRCRDHPHSSKHMIIT